MDIDPGRLTLAVQGPGESDRICLRNRLSTITPVSLSRKFLVAVLKRVAQQLKCMAFGMSLLIALCRDLTVCWDSVQPTRSEFQPELMVHIGLGVVVGRLKGHCISTNIPPLAPKFWFCMITLMRPYRLCLLNRVP